MTTQNTTDSISKELATILGADRVPFNPCAYFDKHMDCIRIELRDCSVKDVRVNEILTIHLDNAPEPTQMPLVGLTIKGVRHLFTEHGIPLVGIIEITEILNKIAKALDEALQDAHEKRQAIEAVDKIRTFARETELKVDMDLAMTADHACSSFR